MAEVTTVEYVKPTVKNVTLKFTVGEARDLKIFIAEWYAKNYSYSGDTKAKAHPVYKAIDEALSGNVSSDKVAPF